MIFVHLGLPYTGEFYCLKSKKVCYLNFEEKVGKIKIFFLQDDTYDSDYSHFEEKEIFVYPLFDIQRLIFEIHTSFLKFKDLSMKFYSLKLQLYSLKLKDHSLSVEFHIFFFEFKDISLKLRDYSNFKF